MKDQQDGLGVAVASGDYVLVLFHVHDHDDGSRDSTMIGVYTSQDAVKNGIDGIATRPGFDIGRASFETISVALNAGPQSRPMMSWRTQRPAI